jgi:quercetin dioxygenase-like cupin family protein
MTADRTARHLAMLLRAARAKLGGGAIDGAVADRFLAPVDRPLLPHRLAAAGNRLPVHRWWGCVLDGLSPDLRPAVATLAPALRWARNPNYRRRPHTRFVARYGYAVLVGPPDRQARPLVPESRLAMGLLMLGPDTVYPRHFHPAEEIYLPLSGAAWWQRGEEPWRRVVPGTPIYHPGGLPHATRTDGAPLLALYIWCGDIGVHARLGGA